MHVIKATLIGLLMVLVPTALIAVAIIAIAMYPSLLFVVFGAMLLIVCYCAGDHYLEDTSDDYD